MIKRLNFIKKKYLYLFFLILIIFPNINSAREILIYADNISYDNEENIIARGNAKIAQENQIIISDLIIYNKKEEKIILPTSFSFKDEENNFYYGSEGYFEKNLEYGEFKDIKIRLSDGSRIIGKSGKRSGHVDIISKGVYSPCISRIKIANFICPTWQLEGEKILHDNKNLFLYQKHSKMRVLNTPVFYVPYLVTPSPLRKERKSGFLSPTIALNFFDTKTSQYTSFPYYFNISPDKELTFTPSINYGGGVDSSQRFLFDYNQILSGGELSLDFTFDSNFERNESDKWLKDASLITNYRKNLNEKFKLNINSALQTSQNYIQITNPNDDLSYTNSLSTNITFEGYNLRKIDDYFKFNMNFYQTSQKNEDNKTIPTVLPNVKYYGGNKIINGYNSNNTYEFYNIFRDKNTSIHAQNQQKMSHKYYLSRSFIKYNSKITGEAEIYNQLFETENKLLQSNEFHSGTHYRLFPIIGMKIESPFKLNKGFLDFTYKPHTQFVLTPGVSNTNKISNEDSSNNNFTIENIANLNRYSGSDKMDNSKRIIYGLNMYNETTKINIFQSYEFTDNSNFHSEQGNDDKLSDLLGSFEYRDNYELNYNFRYDVNENFLKKQNISSKTPNRFGEINLSYLDQKSKTDGIITQDTETINYSYKSKKFLNFSKIKISGLYDLQKEINTEYGIGYSYFDECFGINLDFNRKSYEEDNLKPQDILTLMFSFKNIGSYKSTNLAVSEKDKQDIKWDTGDIDNALFEKIKN